MNAKAAEQLVEAVRVAREIVRRAPNKGPTVELGWTESERSLRVAIQGNQLDKVCERNFDIE